MSMTFEITPLAYLRDGRHHLCAVVTGSMREAGGCYAPRLGGEYNDKVRERITTKGTLERTASYPN